MRFELTPASQRRFGQGLAQVAQRLNKSLLDLLRQTAVYYAQAARKRTPGPWYAAMTKTMKLRPVRELSESEVAIASKETGKPKFFAVEIWTGHGSKSPRWFPTRTEKTRLREIKYRGAAQLSWSAMLKKLFKTEPSPATSANFARVLSQGASVTQRHVGNFRSEIITENNLGYIARLRPGIAGEALIAAQNRVANAYIKRLGDGMRQTWEKA